jgi:hypothetical protein
VKGWWLISVSCWILLGLGGCGGRERVTPPTCPAGDRARGAVPPQGEEFWCEKTVDGKAVKDGPFIVFNDSGGRMIAGTYRDGVQEGEWTMWYANGQRSALDHYRDGQQDGRHISWYANGQKAIEGDYRNGKREGVWTRWDPSGLERGRQVYKDDQVIH